MMACSKFDRADATDIGFDLMYYKKTIMTRITFEAICSVENLADQLLQNAQLAQAGLIEHFVR